jgi:hypothetical protein
MSCEEGYEVAGCWCYCNEKKERKGQKTSSEEINLNDDSKAVVKMAVGGGVRAVCSVCF